jgi:hypothetical protein
LKNSHLKESGLKEDLIINRIYLQFDKLVESDWAFPSFCSSSPSRDRTENGKDSRFFNYKKQNDKIDP